MANTLRLLDLAPEVKDALLRGRITEGHARAIAGLDDPDAAGRCFDGCRIARAVGASNRGARATVATRTGPRTTVRVSALRDVERLESALRDALATKVTINTARKGGRITIEYYDEDDLERLYERLTGGKP